MKGLRSVVSIQGQINQFHKKDQTKACENLAFKTQFDNDLNDLYQLDGTKELKDLDDSHTSQLTRLSLLVFLEASLVPPSDNFNLFGNLPRTELTILPNLA
jgi:hypothetical protein